MAIEICDHSILPPKDFLHSSLEKVCMGAQVEQ